MLQTFLNQYGGLKEIKGDVKTVDYRRLSIDSRTIAPGELFIAIKGEIHDGHKFTFAAKEKRAGAIVLENAWFATNKHDPRLADVNLIIVADTLDFLQQLGAWHRQQFHDLQVIAITGSNGKTTTRQMVAAVLSAKYNTFQSEGNKNNHIGLPLMLLRLTTEHEFAVIELGTNHPGEIGHLTNLCQPTAALITNIGKGHIGYFGSLEAVYEEKTALFRGMPSGQPLFLNMMDTFLREFPQSKHQIIQVGDDDKADVWGKTIDIDRLGRATIRINDYFDIRLQVPGVHNAFNALFAVAVGMHFQISDKAIKNALENFSPASQRMQLVEKGAVVLINDAYNANPNSMRAAIDYLASLENGNGKRIAVLGDMLELGKFEEAEHRDLGTYIAQKNIDVAFLYGPLSRHIKAGIDTAGKSTSAYHYDSHDEISNHLQQMLGEKDAVLFKGSRGMTMERVLTKISDRLAEKGDIC